MATPSKVMASNPQQALPEPVIPFQVPDKYVSLPLQDQKMGDSTAPARILVPYADASQSGGFSRVRLKDSPGE